MGENNTISLLASINGYLKTMVEESKTNASPQQQAQSQSQQAISTLHKGGLSQGTTPQSKANTTKVGNIVIPANMLATLTTLSGSIKGIAKLKGKEIDAFQKVMKSISETVKMFNGDSNIKSATTMVKTADAISKLEKVGLGKLAASMKIANMLGFSTSICKIVDGIVKASKKAGKLKPDDEKKLKSITESVKALTSLTKGTAILMVTVVGMAIAIKKIGAKDIMLSLGITMLALTAMSGLTILIARLASSAKNSTADLSKITKFIFMMQLLVVTSLLLGKLVKSSIKDILVGFAATAGIMLGYTAIIALASMLAKFINVSKAAMSTIMFASMWGVGMTIATLLMGMIAKEAWPMILIGFATVSGIILGYTAVIALASVLAKFVTMDKSTMMVVLLMAAWGMALTLGTLLMGFVAQEAWPQILLGFVAVSGIILGYVAIAALASVIMKLSPGFKADILAVALMAGLGMGLVLGTLLMGCVAIEAWDLIAIGFLTVGLVLEGFAALAKLVSITAKGVGKSLKDFAAIGLLAAAAEGLLLGAVAIAWVTKKAGITVMEVVAVIAGVALILTGLIGLAHLAAGIPSKGVTAGINKMKSLVLLAAAAEGLLLGAVILAKLIEGVKPENLTAVIALTTGIVIGLVKLTNVINKNSKTLATGAKSILMVAAVALASEAILGGAMFLAKYMDAETGVKAIAIIGVCTGITLGIVELVKIVENHNKDLSKGAKSMLLVEGVALGAEAILAGAVLLAKWFDDDPKLIAKTALVFVGITGIVLGLVGVLKLVEKHNKDLTKGAKSMLLLEAVALGAEGLLLGLIMLSKMLDEPGRTAATLETLVIVSGIVLGLVGVVKLVEKHNKDLMKGAKSLALVEAVAAGAGLLLLGAMGIVKLKEEMKVTWEQVIYVVTAMTTIVAAFGGLAVLAGKFDKEMKKGIKSMGMVTLFAGAAELLLAGIIGLMILKNNNKVEWEDIFIAIGAMVTVVGAFGALAYAVGAVDKVVKKALPGIGIITLFAAAGELLLAGIIGLMILKNNNKVEWDDVFIAIGAMATIVGAFGLLGTAICSVTPTVTLGLAGVAVVTLFAAGAELLLGGIIALMGLKNELKVEWDDIFTSIKAMTEIVGLFGLLGTAVGIAAPLVLAGSAGMAAVIACAAGAEALLGGLITLMGKKNELNVTWDDIDESIDRTGKIVENFGVMSGIASLALPFLLAGSAGLDAAIDTAGRAARVLSSVVDVAAKAKALGNNGWTQVEKTVQMMGRLITNTSDNPGFKELCEKASWAYPFLTAGSSGLNKVADTAGLAAKALIVVCQAAEAAKGYSESEIAKVIKDMKVLTDELYDVVGLKFMFKVKTISNARPYINDVSDTTMHIAQMLSDLAGCARNGMIRGVYKLKDGRIKYGQWVDAEKSANTISNTFCGFVDTLHNTFKEMDAQSIELMEKGIKAIGNIMGPVSTFAETMSSFKEAGPGMIKIIKYDDKGKLIDTPPIKVADVAQAIANSMSVFCNTLFTTENQQLWERMVSGGSNITTTDKEGNQITEYSPGDAERAMGIFATLIDPICNFASTLALFQDSPDENTLLIPIYDKDGNIIDTRKVVVTDVATKIAKAAANFMRTLVDNSQPWMDIYKSQNWSTSRTVTDTNVAWGLYKKQHVETESGNHMREAFGVFEMVISPVISFTNLLKSFGDAGEDTLNVYSDDGTPPRPIHPKKIAKIIADTVTGFIQALSNGIANGSSSYLGRLESNSGMIVEVMQGLTEAITPFADIQEPENLERFVTSCKSMFDYILSLNNETKLSAMGTVSEKISEVSTAVEGLTNGWQTMLKNFVEANANSFVNIIGNLNTALASMDSTSKTVSGSIENIDKFVVYISKLGTNGTDAVFAKVNEMFTGVSNTMKALTADLTNLLTTKLPGDNELANMLLDVNSASLQATTGITTFTSTAIKEISSLKGLPSDINNIANSIASASPTIRTNIIAIQTNVNLAVSDPKKGIKKNIDKASDAIRTTTLAVKNFDDTLNRGNSQRIKNIRAITNEIQALHQTANNAKGTLDAVAASFKNIAVVINYAANGQLDTAVKKLNSVSLNVNSGGGGSVDPSAIGQAVAQALNNASVRMRVRSGSSTTYTVIGDYTCDYNSGESLSITREETKKGIFNL